MTFFVVCSFAGVMVSTAVLLTGDEVRACGVWDEPLRDRIAYLYEVMHFTAKERIRKIECFI